jgi:uncharacterized protein YgbK (DUF1537 family)
VTDRQIAHAARAGWVEVPLDLVSATRPESLRAAVRSAAAHARAAIESGRSAIVHTAGRALGAGDDAIRLPRLRAGARRRLGEALGAVAAEVLGQAPVRRLAVAGGDSSGDALRAMGVEAIEISARFLPAMPFCRIHGAGAPDVEVVCKGGQTGAASFFEDVRNGSPARSSAVEVPA